ncbi:MAG TPA: iron-sulfur cluster assembly accessory protein [Candidatus Krumholzibacteria bacterium]|jgi:Fe/S biogenesis protein NfuA|nr:iron-sulfur cluster assembly accessory protein [Candidatus Krumholzibacteria bacterium]
MITITEAASKQLSEILESQEGKDHCLRLAISGRGAQGFEYELTLLRLDEKSATDVVVSSGALTVLVDGPSQEDLKGATLDFVLQAGGQGFKIDNPNPLWRDPVALKVQRVIDTEINPGVATHGGYVALLDVRDGKAYIRLGGGCQGCGMVSVTLKQGIEKSIVGAVPEIAEVLDTTDHAAGQNPFYQPAKSGHSPFD